MATSPVGADVKLEYIPTTDGLDTETPPLAIKSGSLKDAANFEIGVYGGYRRISGYEKFDGQPSPLSYGYACLPVISNAGIVPGEVVVGATSGASGRVIGSDGENLIFLTAVTGNFQDGEGITVSGLPGTEISEPPYIRLDVSDEIGATMMALSADYYRTSIGSVPGNGEIRGLQWYDGALYTWRDDGAESKMYKSTPSGWQQVIFDKTVPFENGKEIENGETLTQGGVTAEILRVVVREGSLTAGDAKGVLVIDEPVGGNFASGAATTDGTGTLDLLDAESDISLLPGGRVDATVYNFGIELRLYFVNSANEFAYEFDGTTLVPIDTGMRGIAPHLIACHKNMLFLAYDKSLQHSGLSDDIAGIYGPYGWTPLLGAGELNTGEHITNLAPQPSDDASGGAMVVSTRNRMMVLYGSSDNDWNLVTYQGDVGSIEHSMQIIANQTYFADDRGVTSLATAKEFGNFLSGTISARIRRWLVERKPNLVDSCIVREKNQYRLFYRGGTALYITFQGAKPVGFMPIQFAHDVVVAHSTEIGDGTERVFYGDSDGNVYQADVGNSFAGLEIRAFFTTHYNNCNSARVRKRFRGGMWEVQGEGYSDFLVGSSFDYGLNSAASNALSDIDLPFSNDKWDDPAMFWDQGFWDSTRLLPIPFRMSGSGENVSLTVFQNTNKYASLTFNGAIVRYSPRRIIR